MELPDISRLPKKQNNFLNKYGVKALVFTQIFIISGLSTFVLTRVSNLYSLKVAEQNNTEISGQVAGISTDSLPEKILISIGNQVEYLETSKFDFEVKYLEETPETVEPESKIKIFLSIFKKKEAPKVEKYIDFNQAKLEYWFLNKFKDQQTEDRISPEIAIDPETQVVIGCTVGNGSSKLPLTQIFNKLKSLPLEESMEFKAIESQLTPEETNINSICDQINKFEAILLNIEIEEFNPEAKPKDEPKIKEYPFIERDKIKELFEYKFIEEDLITIELKDEEKFLDELEILKVVIDVEPSKYDYKTRETTLYILGEFEAGRFLNIPDTMEAFYEELKKLNEFEEFPIVFDEIDQIDEIENLDIQRYPQIIGTGIVKTPLDPLKRTNSIKRLLNDLDAYVIPEEEEFSFIKFIGNNSEKENYLYGETLYNVEEVELNYYENIEAVSSLLYRSALETGLPITDRLQDMKANYTDYYTFPYSDGVITTSVILPSKEEEEVIEEILEDSESKTTEKNIDDEKEEIINQAEPQDFRFLNDTGKPILLTTSNYIGDDGLLYLEINIYTTEVREPREVIIKKFKRNSFTSNTEEGFVEMFIREVDGKEEEFYTTFYK